MPDIGYTSPATNNAANFGATSRMLPVIAPEDGTVDSVSAYVELDNQAGEDWRVAIYSGGASDSDPTGATLLEDLGLLGSDQTNETWKTVMSSSNPSFDDGDRLWVAFKTSQATGIQLDYEISEVGDWAEAAREAVVSNSDESVAWESTIDGAGESSVEWYSAYITYTASTGTTAALTGTLANDATESEIVDGGETLIITLTNDTWEATVGADNAITQAIIDGLDSDGAETNGWDAVVRAGLDFDDVTRDSDTQITITLPAFVSYDITADETITVTIPASALVTSGDPVVADSTFDVTAEGGSSGAGINRGLINGGLINNGLIR